MGSLLDKPRRTVAASPAPAARNTPASAAARHVFRFGRRGIRFEDLGRFLRLSLAKEIAGTEHGALRDHRAAVGRGFELRFAQSVGGLDRADFAQRPSRRRDDLLVLIFQGRGNCRYSFRVAALAETVDEAGANQTRRLARRLADAAPAAG